MAITAVLLAVCGAPGATSSTPTATIAATTPGPPSPVADEIEKIRARGTLVVAVRLEAPPTNRAMGDPAHAQKRAFEMAVASLVASAVFGGAVKVQFQSQGGDRLGSRSQGADLAMVTESPGSRDRASISSSYAANSVVVAMKDGAAIARLEDLSSKAVGVAQDELVTRDLAQMFFQQRGVTPTLDTFMGVNGGATALENDRAVAFVGDGIGVASIAVERKLRVLTEVALRPYVMASRQNAPDLATAVDAAVRDALKSGAIKDAAVRAGFPYTAP